jgi:hypothetical protein
MTIKDLRAILLAYELDSSNCIEKNDMMELLEKCPEIMIV